MLERGRGGAGKEKGERNKGGRRETGGGKGREERAEKEKNEVGGEGRREGGSCLEILLLPLHSPQLSHQQNGNHAMRFTVSSKPSTLYSAKVGSYLCLFSFSHSVD